MLGQVEERSLVTEFEDEATPRVALTHSSPGVGDDAAGVVSHLGGGAVLPAKETSDGAVPFKDGGEDGTVADCVEGVGDVHSDDGIFLAEGEIGHTGAKLHAAAEATPGLYGLKTGTNHSARDIGSNSTK